MLGCSTHIDHGDEYQLGGEPVGQQRRQRNHQVDVLSRSPSEPEEGSREEGRGGACERET